MPIRLKVRVTPNARKNTVVSWTRDEVRLKIKAPPVEGKANAALIEYLSELTSVPRAKIQLKAGEKSRIKLVEIDALTPDELRSKIQSHISATLLVPDRKRSRI
jgi:uncharacterized protein